MNIIGIIPARYESSRLPGKPLADICGKPMIWWVYQQARKVDMFSELMIAADHPAIYEVCDQLGLTYVKTSSDHPSHMHRLLEVAEMHPADAYVCVCGDEPLIEPEVISAVVPQTGEELLPVLVRGVYRELQSPTETIDPGNIKIITDEAGRALALSRTPLPTPYKTIEFKYKKTIGIECFNRAALEFYVGTPKGPWETAEDIMMLRFVEHHIPAFFREVVSKSLSVDTERDLEFVRDTMRKKLMQRERE